MAEGKAGEVADSIALRDIRFGGDSALCPVEARLEFDLDFEALRPLRDAIWEIKYIVDTVRKRNIIVLGRTEETNYDGDSSLHFAIERVDVSHIKPSHLSNAGLLVCSLTENGGADEVAEINMVVQVTPQMRAGSNQEEFIRCIYSPLE